MVVLTGCDSVVTTVPEGVVRVVWVVCVVCIVVGADGVRTVAVATGAVGGGAETTCDWGSEAQPAMNPITPKITRSGARDFTR